MCVAVAVAVAVAAGGIRRGGGCGCDGGGGGGGGRGDITLATTGHSEAVTSIPKPSFRNLGGGTGAEVAVVAGPSGTAVVIAQSANKRVLLFSPRC